MAQASLPPTRRRRAQLPQHEAIVEAMIDVLAATRNPRDDATTLLLVRIGILGIARPSDIAAHVGLDLSTVSRHLGQLTERGLIERIPDPVDGRAFRVDLTKAGRAAVKAYKADRAARLIDALGHWDPADRDQLAASLRRLADDLRPAPPPSERSAR